MSLSERPLIITGFMGAGKTTVAAALALRMGCRMIDLDRFIKEREGRTARLIIEDEGEQLFREVESSALHAALETEDARVIALGGGAWTIEKNRAVISEHGCFTVWLDAPFELCWKRIIAGSVSRPLARDLESARRLYEERRSLYDQATLRVEVTEEKSAEAIAAEIVNALPRAAA